MERNKDDSTGEFNDLSAAMKQQYEDEFKTLSAAERMELERMFNDLSAAKKQRYETSFNKLGAAEKRELEAKASASLEQYQQVNCAACMITAQCHIIFSPCTFSLHPALCTLASVRT